MSNISNKELNFLWSRHHAEWRDCAQVTSQWREAAQIDKKLLSYTVQGKWWETLEDCGKTLLITREYEHLVMAICANDNKKAISYTVIPHPSGLAIDNDKGIVHIASTRNPNQIYDFVPAVGLLSRLDIKQEQLSEKPLVPLRTRFLPGCLYMHDLELIGGNLYANAVGQNAVIRLFDNGNYEREWWPKCIETDKGPIFGQNHIQLNSIAAGTSLMNSYFSASGTKLSSRRPGHKNYPVDKQGIIISGKTREPIAWGLTRPHSTRLYKGKIWVDNSGYGEFGYVEDGIFVPIVKLPGWTRGLCFNENIAFVGTSRVIPRFSQYAPGLDVDNSICALHAVNIESGKVLGSLTWPFGNQIFALGLASSKLTTGFPFSISKRSIVQEKKLFYTFKTCNL